ncbi:MAG TPA: YfiR family protein [Ramlibacter sp.]|uniref:YfiR family protein n=1 Tax=Ramlibacter sp. TaxID=1917967 RepID=UPI002B809625|nr:YfiR family protein [Ramlibacter sp.]HVZ42590.1 YfiR family protein [Ramlibacter sp.]
MQYFPHAARLSRRRLVAGAGALLLLASQARAQSGERLRESLVKAAFLHKFASFVEWPDGTFARADAPLRIGVYGDDLVWKDLSELARDRDRDGHPVIVTRLGPGDSFSGYHILYFKADSPGRMADLLQQVPEGVLTVSDSNGTHPRGCVISFYLEEGRVHFGASVEAAARQKLRLSQRLLSAARMIQGGLDALRLLA